MHYDVGLFFVRLINIISNRSKSGKNDTMKSGDWQRRLPRMLHYHPGGNIFDSGSIVATFNLRYLEHIIVFEGTNKYE